MVGSKVFQRVRWGICGIALFVSGLGTAVAAEEIPADALEFFEKSVRPLLVETCYECHSSKKQEGELRLDGAAYIKAGSASGPVINTDDVSASRLLTAIGYQNEIKMPPDFRLDPEEVEILRAWVVMGAPWPEEDEPEPIQEPRNNIAEQIRHARETHWAFRPVMDPPIPEVKADSTVRTLVDAFIFARLDDAGLTPSPEANRRTLIRRLYYDLTGLPPSIEAVLAFQEDDRPDAYMRLVEELLASPHYGERWGRHWLDVARYADTKGYVFEEERLFPYSYTYRDYVIRSFNEDLPFDQFIIEQLAADRLDLGDDKRPLAALGYLTLGRKFLNRQDDIIDDRIDVVTRGMLGLTVTCARCHDHKFDPIPAEDYYALYGVFRSSTEPKELPLISDPDPNDPVYQEFLSMLTEKEHVLTEYEANSHIDLLMEVRQEWQTYLLTALEALDMEDDTTVKKLAKEREIRYMVLQRWTTYLKKKVEEPDAIFRPLALYFALSPEAYPDESSVIAGRITAADSGEDSVHPLLREAFQGDPPATWGEVGERYVKVLENVDDEWRNRLAIYAQLSTQEDGNSSELPARLENSEREALRLVLYAEDAPANIPAKDAYAISETPVQQAIRSRRRDVARHEATHLGRPHRAMALEDLETPFDPYIFLRGKPGNKGDKVERHFMQVLSESEPEPFTNGSGRLDLAQAIANPQNPLTARVFVNRVWMHYFGQPLVNTPSDFGLRSDPPTHPELLDHLAAYFMEHNWSIKELHRHILLSSTYRQTSQTNQQGEKTDLENRLLWRQNRKRLDFESMRDALLAVTGELDLALGGPPESLTETPYSIRRTVYGQVERQNMAGFIKAFDFASPDTHSPKRFHTIVPQQALYLMNSPFAIERAQALEARFVHEEDQDPAVLIRELFLASLKREPSPKELKRMVDFVTRADIEEGPPPPPLPEWRYGYGGFSVETGHVENFVKFDVFKEKRWQPLENYPNEEFGYVTVQNNGGHPGHDNQQSAIHRWIAPRDGSISIEAKLRHNSDKGDGVLGYIVSSQNGLLHESEVFNGFEDAKLENILVEKGDTIDFVAAPNTAPSFDSYSWSQTIIMDIPEGSEGEGMRTEWEARADFAGPPPAPPAPLSAWGQLAQVLLMTNEFMYID